MKLIINLLLLALVAAAVLPFVTFGPNGNALLKPPDLKLPDFDIPMIPEFMTTPKSNSGSIQPAPVYKWHDAEGHTHYTAEPPAQGVQSELLTLGSDTNVVPAVESPAQSNKVTRQRIQEDSFNSVYSPANVRQLMDDARNVQNLLNERAEELQRRTER